MEFPSALTFPTDNPSIKLESEVEAQRAQRRSVSQADAGRTTQVAHRHIARARKHVAAVDKPDDGGNVLELGADFSVEHDDPIAAVGQAVVVQDARHTKTILLKPAHTGAASREEATTGR